MTERKPQVKPEHYKFPRYLDGYRWASYGRQIGAVMAARPGAILEIGIGNGIVRSILKSLGFEVVALDIDPDLKPDVVGDVTKIPLADKSFDFVLCAEVLEHLPYGDFPSALGELRRVARTGGTVLLALPHAGAVFLLRFKIPLCPQFTLFFKIPYFWKVHIFNGEHYWEMGKRGYSARKIRAAIEGAGFKVEEMGIHADDPAHYFFLLKKTA